MTSPRARFAIVKSIRRDVVADIRRTADDALGDLEVHNALSISTPQVTSGGEWDWFWHLSRPEQLRLTQRWVDPVNGRGPDVIADYYSTDVDDAMRSWLRCTRLIDAARHMRVRRSGAVVPPSPARLGGLEMDDLFPHPEYSLADLFASQPYCLDYIDSLDDDHDDEDEGRDTTWDPSNCSTLETATF